MITELTAKNAKPREKSYKLHDGRGLYLRIDPTGNKYWILRYWENRKERQLSLGPYPVISLREAREQRDAIQNARARGQSPTTRPHPPAPTMEAVINEWLNVRMTGKAPKYIRATHQRLQKYILPAIGHKDITAVTSGDILRICRDIERTGKSEIPRRVKGIISMVFKYAIAAGYAEADPAAPLAGALQPQQTHHMATVTDPVSIRRILDAMREYPFPVMRAALLLSIYTFARPGEIRAAEWTEIKGNVWDIPAGKMKMKRRHIVPLSRQAQEIIKELRSITGKGRYLFPSPRNDDRCMSENGVRVALRTLGFDKETITPHGFRAMASTILNERGFNRDVIERQLSHVEGNSVRRAYNHAEYLEERENLMQYWADYLDNL